MGCGSNSTAETNKLPELEQVLKENPNNNVQMNVNQADNLQSYGGAQGGQGFGPQGGQGYGPQGAQGYGPQGGQGEENKKDLNEITCIYIAKKVGEVNTLLNDFDYDIEYKLYNHEKVEYFEAKNTNKKLFEEIIDLYINDKKFKFDFKYKIKDSNETKDSNEIKVKFKFNKKLTTTI